MNLTILLQDISTVEVRTVLHGSMLMDNVEVVRSNIKDLPNLDLSKNMIPVGSVEFVSDYMALIGVNIPKFETYPSVLNKYLNREIRKTTFSEIKNTDKCFIKPVKLKQFNGFVYDRPKLFEQYSDHDKDQLLILNKNLNIEVWMSDIIEFESEWRYYINRGVVIGSARYDPDGADDAKSPNLAIVRNAVIDMNLNHPYTLDFGVLKDGSTVLVEANDAWAIGYYKNSMSSKEYVKFLVDRWNVIVKNNKKG